ncbi:MAG: signal transduction histidine kinase [Pseudohongiellaceae bacterium]|jgi:signal transduction histidine kinase
MLEKTLADSNNSTPDNSNSALTYLPFRGPFSRWPRTSEAVVVAAVFLASVFVPSDNENHNTAIVLRTFANVPIFIVIVLAIASCALFWRRSYPLRVLATTLGLMALSTALGYSFDFFGVPVVLYSVGRYEKNDRLSQIGGGAIGVVGLILLFDSSETLPDIGIAFVLLFLSWYVGRRIHARGEYLRLLQERAEQLEREKVNASQRAVAEERGRIARELHDIVAHQVSLMTVQAGAAKTVAGSNLTKAIQAMEAVEIAGRQALVELRHLLGVIRPETGSSQLTPQPGLTDVPKLIDSFSRAGLSVSLSVNAPQAKLPVGIDLTIYRIIQEALTNVIKHAGGNVMASVIVQIDRQGVNIEIDNNGNLRVESKDLDNGKQAFEPSGYGIVGMQERANMLGGSFEAKPNESGGFAIRCYIPIEQDTRL